MKWKENISNSEILLYLTPFQQLLFFTIAESKTSPHICIQKAIPDSLTTIIIQPAETNKQAVLF